MDTFRYTPAFCKLRLKRLWHTLRDTLYHFWCKTLWTWVFCICSPPTANLIHPKNHAKWLWNFQEIRFKRLASKNPRLWGNNILWPSLASPHPTRYSLKGPEAFICLILSKTTNVFFRDLHVGVFVIVKKNYVSQLPWTFSAYYLGIPATSKTSRWLSERHMSIKHTKLLQSPEATEDKNRLKSIFDHIPARGFTAGSAHDL